MKKAILIATALILAAGIARAQPAMLRLQITAPIGATNADQCQYAAATGSAVQSDGPLITEQDVVAWEPDTGSLTLDPARFNNANARLLVDRCFMLTIAGQRPIHGVVLYSYSARLIKFPRITVSPRNQALVLHLHATHGMDNDRVYTPALDRVLHDKPRSAPGQP